MGLFKKKQTIDPVEFLVLRNELVELKERLDAAEQSKASLEDRLSSLAATTMVLSSNAKSDTAEIVEKIESLEHRIENILSNLKIAAKRPSYAGRPEAAATAIWRLRRRVGKGLMAVGRRRRAERCRC